MNKFADNNQLTNHKTHKNSPQKINYPTQGSYMQNKSLAHNWVTLHT